MNNLIKSLTKIPLVTLSVVGLNCVPAATATTATPENTQATKTLIAQQVTCGVVNIRTGQLALRFTPNGESRAGLDNGNTVALLRRDSAPWVYVRVINGLNSRVNGLEGWVNSNYLSCGEVSSTPQATATNTSIPQAWQNAQLVRTLDGPSNLITSIVISTDNQTLISGNFDKTIKIWNMQTGELRRTLYGSETGSRTVAISPDKQILASGSQGIVEAWNLNTGDLLYRLSGAGSTVAIIPDGQTLASGISDNTVKLWNLRSGELRQALPGLVQGSVCMSISSNGIILAAGSLFDKTNLWNLHTGELTRTLKSGQRGGQVISIAISPNGEILATSSDTEPVVRIWNLQTGELIRTLEGHSNKINSVAISPDGQILASGSADGTIRILNLRTRELIRVLKDAGKVISVSFSPDSRTLASGSEDGKIRIWQVP
jgi:WD40 repeat protein